MIHRTFSQLIGVSLLCGSVVASTTSAHGAGYGAPAHALSGRPGRSTASPPASEAEGSGNNNGNANVGSFNGNGNGNGNRSRGDGNANGNGNVGTGNGNANGNGNSRARSGNNNGNNNRGAFNGNLNGNFNGNKKGAVAQHLSLNMGAVHLSESFRDLPSGSLVGRFTFRDGPVIAKGSMTYTQGTWQFSFTVAGMAGIDHMTVVGDEITQTSFAGCLDCGGFGNRGAFEGLGNASPTSGNFNVGLFNGDFNGGSDNGNNNRGAFNGNFNGLGYSPFGTSGSDNGNNNQGVFNGNFNGNAAWGRGMAGSAAGTPLSGHFVSDLVRTVTGREGRDGDPQPNLLAAGRNTL